MLVGSGAASTQRLAWFDTHTELDSLADLAATTLRGIQPVSILRRRCNGRPRAATAVPGTKYKL